MIDLEYGDGGELRHPPGPPVQARAENHQLLRPPHPPIADGLTVGPADGLPEGLVDGDGTRHHHLTAGPHHLELEPRPHPRGGTPPRTHSTTPRSSARRNIIAVGSSNRSMAMRPCATARPWHTSTAVRLAPP